ncbi:hypothetical protein GCM10023258_16200 [Terrabacter aeriphilus]|uniref:Uncharacterized protein n=1 Tax=Terrabacter aeriphilus TaxID=515662 RepID=A0ABP9JAL9_9MICO
MGVSEGVLSDDALVDGLPLSAVAEALQALAPSTASTATPDTAAERMLDFTRKTLRRRTAGRSRAGRGAARR